MEWMHLLFLKTRKNINPSIGNLIDQLKPGSTVQLTTTRGEITITLYPDRAPVSVTSFLQLCY